MAKKAPATSPTPRKRTSTKKPNGDASASVAWPSAEDIRIRAYHRYLERGANDGGDFDDWVEAEKDLKSSRS